MRERSERATTPHSNLRSKCVGIRLRINAAYVFVCAAEICSHAKPIVEIAGQRSVEAVRIHATVEPCVLVAAEDFRFGIVLLRYRRQRKQPQQQHQADKLTHLYAPKDWNLHPSRVTNCLPSGGVNLAHTSVAAE